jgi:hypothetical protein
MLESVLRTCQEWNVKSGAGFHTTCNERAGKPQEYGCSVGRPVQEMWGAQWTAYAEDAADHGALQVLSRADLSPVQALLDACILAPLQELVGPTHAAFLLVRPSPTMNVF